MANYRRIFLLMTFSKVVEATMYNTINHHLQVNNILAAEQYGFRGGLSTENVACTLIGSRVKAWLCKSWDFNNEIAVLWTSRRKH